MFSLTITPPLPSTHHHLAPSKPPPLSSRNPNTPSPFSSPFSKRHIMTTTPSTSNSCSSNILQTASRLSPNPVAAINRRTSKDQRRESFFKKVKDQRDESRFEARGEQTLRREFVDERRRWEDNLTRSAPASIEADFDGMNEDENTQGPPKEDEEEFDLVSYRTIRESQEFYDEDYDQIFAELVGMESPELDCDRNWFANSSMENPIISQDDREDHREDNRESEKPDENVDTAMSGA